MDKPREFWIETHDIVKNIKDPETGFQIWPKVYESKLTNTLHVIEKSAYDTLKAQADKLADVIDKCLDEDTDPDIVFDLLFQARKDYRGEK